MTDVTFFDTMDSGKELRMGSEVGICQNAREPVRAVLSGLLCDMSIYILKHLKTHEGTFHAF